MKTIGIIGLGLIGGSMAIDLKRRGFASRVLGVEKEPVNAAAAKKIGLVDETRTVSRRPTSSSSPSPWARPSRPSATFWTVFSKAV